MGLIFKVAVDFMDGGEGRADMGMVMEEHIGVFGMLHGIDYQLDSMAGLKDIA